MTKRRSTKGALLMSVLSLFLCFSMLLGTTFAWFTDEVESGKNVIKSGNLDITLEYYNGTGWTDVKGASAILDANALWEPGYTEVAYFRIKNNGSLALKYQFGVNIVSETEGVNKAGESFKLSDYIYFDVVEGVNGENGFADRNAAMANATEPTKISAGYSKAGELKAGSAYVYLAMVIYMPTTVGNVANHNGTAPSIELGVNVLATQLASESDGFDTDYDEDAWVEGWQVYNAQDLQAAINNGETNITLMDDIELNESIVIPAAPTTYSLRNATPAVVIDLNGKTITGNVGRDADGNRVHVIVNNGNAVIKNGVITSAGVNGGSAIYNADGATLTVENVTLNGAPQEGSTWPSYTVNNYGTLTVSDSSIYGVQGIIATNNTANTTVNNVIAYRDGWSSGHVFYTSSTAKVTINGGTYTNDGNGVDGTMIYGGETVVNGGTFIVKEGAYFALCSGSKLTVNGGDFSNIKSCLAWGGAMTISGGTFGFNPTTYVADGFKAVANNGKYVVVSDSISDENVIGTPDELASALTGAAAAGSGDNTIYMTGDLDLTGTTWTPIKVDGYQGAGVVTIEGNGATITGLTAPLFAGGFAGKSGIIIRNLTIADSNIVSTSGLGGGAFIDSADSMHVITLENCHLVNSTVSGERTGGLIGWCSGYAKLNDGPVKAYITITNCSVVDSKVIGAGSAGAIAGHPGASDYTYTTIEKCLVKNVEVVSNDTGSWRTGAVVGTANNGHVVINNVTVEDVTLTQNGVTAESNLLFGRFVPSGTGTLVIDGATVVIDNDALETAVANGATNLYLVAGEYDIKNCGGKTLTINGSKDVVLKVMNEGEAGSDYGFDGSNVTFNGVTFDTSANNGNYKGYARMVGTYNDCTFNGSYALNKDSEFTNCTFNVSGDAYNIWTWGAPNATFTGCTFNSDGKAVLLYGGVDTNLTLNGCTFNDNGGLSDKKAAVEIGNDYGRSYTLTVNNTVVNGYEINDKGINTGSTLWGNKNSMGTDKLNVVVDGVDVY